jgi:uncharacterized membrane protein YraQ (UPF0718 family)
MISAIAHALYMAALMGWEMLWALILGFCISGAIQAVVSHKEMARLLPDARWPSILRASALGAASSSCSYAAAAIARSVVQKGGNFTAAMAFQFASTNLVVELGLVLLTLIGWRFMAASWLGGLVMIVILVVLMRLLVGKRLTEAAKAQADRNLPGKMEGHAAMDMSVGGDGSIWKRLISPDGFTATAHFFVMDWASLWLDLVIGVVVAGALAAWVPTGFWAHLFLTGHPLIAKLGGPFIGPLVAVMSFVCSVGNVPLAAVLWRGGASFGGVIAFIFADLIVLPILDIYRRYYGLKMAAVLFGVFYLAMALAGLLVEGVFALLNLTPTVRDVHVMTMGFAWNWTTWLNLALLAVAAMLGWRFMTTGGPDMLKAMDAPGPHAVHCHST